MKRFFLGLLVVFGAVALSGCSGGSFGTSTKTEEGSAPSGGSVLKSFDSGETFVPKVKIDDKRAITSADILTIAFDPNDSSIVYVGTESDGILRTQDGGERWEPINFPPKRVFGLIVDFRNSNRMLASGIWEKVGKIYETEDGGKNWKEVYTEPGKDTLIAAIAQSRANPDLIFAGTTGGVLLRSFDNGKTWQNFAVAKGPVTEIYPHPSNTARVIASVFNSGVIFTENDGAKWTEILSDKFQSSKRQPSDAPNQGGQSKGVLTLANDPTRPDMYFAGTGNGMFRSSDYGKTWTEVNIIESARKYQIRAIAVNPKNSEEISFVAGDTFYRSTDGGNAWKPVRLRLPKGVSVVAYDWNVPDILYLGLRKF